MATHALTGGRSADGGQVRSLEPLRNIQAVLVSSSLLNVTRQRAEAGLTLYEELKATTAEERVL